MPVMKVPETFDLLGRRVKDKVTGFKGVVTTISIDLPGCVQAIVNAGVDEKGEYRDGKWFDVNRLELVPGDKVMQTPLQFDYSSASIFAPAELEAARAVVGGPVDKSGHNRI